jgi:adenylate kinase
MQGRAAKEGRSDDTPEAFQRRRAVYREQTAPLIDFYRKRGVVKPVAATGTVEEIAQRVAEAVR